MGLGEGVGWQGEGTGWQREGAEGPQLVTLCLSTEMVHIHTGLAGVEGGGDASPWGVVTYGEEGTRPDNARSGPTQNSVGLPREGSPVRIRMARNGFEVIYPCFSCSLHLQCLF